MSFETTLSCTCNCQHCDQGGKLEGEQVLTPEDFHHKISILQPSVIQLSGGEPLLREDICEVARAIKNHPNKLPYIILVSNASLLTRDKYIKLKEAGINRISVSLDFPDERHDEFRRHPGLYAHLEKTLPSLAAEFGNDDLAVNVAITRVNSPYIVEMAKKAKEWGIGISYSAYGELRTGNKDFFITDPEDLNILRQSIDEIIQLKKENGNILNSVYALKRTYQFFKDGAIPNCPAGRRFLVIKPSGNLVPCSMMPHETEYSSQKELIEKFLKNNECGQCYVGIRAYCDKTLGILIKDAISFFFANVVKI